MINSACARLLGSRLEEVVGKGDAELFSPEAARSIMELERRIMAGEGPPTLEET